MRSRTEVAFSASARSLRQLIIPALPSEDSTAREQARVIADLLTFSASHSTLEYARKRFELGCTVRTARRIVQTAPREPHLTDMQTALSSAIPLERSCPPYADMHSVNERLADLVSAVITDTYGSSSVRALRRRIVLEEAAALIEMQRSWFSEQGFDPFVDDLAPIDHFLSFQPFDITETTELQELTNGR